MNLDEPWLSIITVVKDDEVGFNETAASLKNQVQKDFEWVVVDSSTIQLSESAEMHYIWMAPQGVYAAMNQGLEMARGKLVYFLNAGDRLSGPRAIEKLKESKSDDCDAVICKVRFIHGDEKVATPRLVNIETESRFHFARGLFPSHQGFVAKRNLLIRLGSFNTDYQIAADYDMFLRLFGKAKICSGDFVLAEFATGGISSQRWMKAQLEFHKARRKNLRMNPFQRLVELLLTIILVTKMSLARLLGRTK